MTIEDKITYYETPQELNDACLSFIKKTNRVLDVGCGICPQAYFKPHLHVCLEPFQEYIDILKIYYGRDPGFLILSGMALDVLKNIPSNSFESVFLIDVIEHIEKEEGSILIKELERVATKQVLIFTPLGFMPQHYEEGETDAWGLGGAEFQEHKSGWEPKDFDDRWNFYVCKEFHKPLESSDDQEMFGAFWSVLNVDEVALKSPSDEKILLIADELLTTSKKVIEFTTRHKNLPLDNYDMILFSSEMSLSNSIFFRFFPKITILLRIEKLIKIFFIINNAIKGSSYSKIIYFSESKNIGRFIKFLASKKGISYEQIDGII